MKKLLALLAVSTLALAACGGDDDASSSDTAPAPVGVTVAGAWARTSPMNAEMGAMYASITAADADVLVEVKVPMSVAMGTEIHETTMGENDMMSMREVGRIDLPAGETVVLEPGGLHVMLMMLPEPLVTGESFTATLVFENAGEVEVDVEIREDSM